MLDYSIKAILFQVLFLAIYDLFLKKETFFQWNRWYLLVTSLLSYIIPLIKIQTISQVVPNQYVVALPEVVLYPSTFISKNVTEPTQVFNYLSGMYWLGVAVMALLFIYKLIRLITLIHSGHKQKINQFFLVRLKGNQAFSFFNYIFLGQTIAETSQKQIITHEMVHVAQKHSLDLLFFELQKIICWFNPMSYVFQRRIAEIHEFIADAHAVKESDTTTYFNKLLADTFGTQTISFINPFFNHSLIKKRIFMLHKNRSKQLLKFKYLLLVPLLGGMLMYSSCEKELVKDVSVISKNERRAIKLYMKGPNDTEFKVVESDKLGYFDIYLFEVDPAGKEISYAELTEEEKTEYDNLIEIGKKSKNSKFESYMIFEMPDGSRALKKEIDWKGMKASWNSEDYKNADEVPFSRIDKAPVFPGCETIDDPKRCFEEAIANHVAQNFNTELVNSLDLEPGKKRVYVQFEIAKEGNISYVRARGPHKKLEDEAVNVIYDLPRMTPGEQGDRKVAVTYTLPITLVVN